MFSGSRPQPTGRWVALSGNHQQRFTLSRMHLGKVGGPIGRTVLRFERLRLTPAANPFEMKAKFRDRPMRTQQASGITRVSCGSRLIEGGSGRYIRPRSGPSIQ